MPRLLWIGGDMKNLKTGNYIELRDISDGFPYSPWQTQQDGSMFRKGLYTFWVLLRRSKIFVIKNRSLIISSVGAILNGNASVGKRISRMFTAKIFRLGDFD